MQLKPLLTKCVLLFILFLNILPCISCFSTKELIPKKECDKISTMEVRYNEFYELYLGHTKGNDKLQKHGIIYQSLTKAVNACCPGLNLSFTLVNESVESLVQEDILHHHHVWNESHLIFYFPEFTSQAKLGNVQKNRL